MAITEGNRTVHKATTGQNASFAHNNDGDCLLVGVYSNQADAAANPTGVTYNGVTMTSIATVAYASSSGLRVFRLVAPAAGSNTVAVTWGSGSNNPRIVVAASFSGVDQTTPEGTPVTQTSNSSSAPSVAVTSATGELVVDFAGWAQVGGTDTTATVGADQTERVNELQTVVLAKTGLAVSTEPGAATTTMSWSLDQTCRIRVAGVPLKPAAASSSGQLVGGVLLGKALAGGVLVG